MSLIARPFYIAFQSYNKAAIARPLLTMSITTGVTMGVGSYACQIIKNRGQTDKKPLNFVQMIQYAAYGAFFTGPVLKYWWYTLDNTIFKNKAAFLRPVKMMVLDIVTVRFIIIAGFVYYASKCEGKSISKCNQDFKEKIAPVYIESLKVWPAATLINFYLVPLPLRVLFANVVALGWNTYMAYLVQDPVKKQ